MTLKLHNKIDGISENEDGHRRIEGARKRKKERE